MRVREHGYTIGFEPVAVLEHHYTGIHEKTRHFFYGPEMIRLYFCMKHLRPRSWKEWFTFWRYELHLMKRGLIRVFRKLFSSLRKKRFSAIGSTGFEILNLMLARVAVPWLYFRARRESLKAV